MGTIYEIHKYEQDDFKYVVASTNKYPETKVRNDVERMNSMLNESVRTMGIKYVFVVSDTSDSVYKERKKKNVRAETTHSAYFLVITNSARRFWKNEASSTPLTSGRLLPYETIFTLAGDMPRARI